MWHHFCIYKTALSLTEVGAGFREKCLFFKLLQQVGAGFLERALFPGIWHHICVYKAVWELIDGIRCQPALERAYFDGIRRHHGAEFPEKMALF